MALAFDGTPATSTFHTTNTGAVTLTTTGTDDVIIVVMASERNTALDTVISSISDTAGLTWTMHKQLHWQPTASATRQTLEVWWAHASAALTSDVITATLNQNTDDSCMVAFGVTGANFSSPFDTNASIPGTATNAAGTNTHPTVTGLTTNASNFLALIMQADAQGINLATPAGYTAVASLNNGLGSLQEQLDVDYQIITGSAWASQTVDYGANSNNWGMIVTAIREAVSEADVTASPALGVSQATTVTTEASISASPALGIGMAVTVGAAGEQDETVAAALGVSMAAALQLERDVAAAMGIGVTMQVRSGSRIRQPVIVCTT